MYDAAAKDKIQQRIFRALQGNKPDALQSIFHALFAAIPHDWYRKNNLTAYEGYYCSVFYCYFAALGLDVRPEEVTSHGLIDMALLFAGRVYIFEFKVRDLDQTPGKALAQLQAKGYADKFRATAQAIYLIGVEFDRQERNIVEFEWEEA